MRRHSHVTGHQSARFQDGRNGVTQGGQGVRWDLTGHDSGELFGIQRSACLDQVARQLSSFRHVGVPLPRHGSKDAT